MLIHKKTVWQWDEASDECNRYTKVYDDVYEYFGEVAEACGATGQQQQLADEQMDMYKQASDQATAVFGNASKVFNSLFSTFSPTIAQGPSQLGYSPAELSALNSQAITQTGQAYRNAAAATGNMEDAVGGGNTALPSGANIGADASLAVNAANQTAGELGQIKLSDYQQGNQNYNEAVSGMENATNTFGAATNSTQADTGAGSAAGTTLNQIQQANAAADQMVVGAISSAAGATCPVSGTLYLMSDGTEKKVENLLVGDSIMGIDCAPQTIYCIYEKTVPIVKTVTANGYSVTSSTSHALALEWGGFTIVRHASGKTVKTVTKPSRVISVEPVGTGRVFNVLTDGSHTYRADGIWSLGVGEEG